MITLNRQHFEVISKQMEALIKNTGLPDAVKLHTSELVAQRFKTSVADNFFKRVNPLEMLGKVINSKVSGGLQNINAGLENALFPLEMITSMQDSGMGGGVRGGAEQFFSTLLMMGANYGYGKLFKNIDKSKTNGLSSNIIGMASNPLEYFKSKRSRQNTGLLGRQFNKLINMLSGEVNYREAADKLSGKNLAMPTPFDGITHTSINTVIPTLLSKIHNELVTIRTGKKFSTDDELIFDASSGKMTSKQALKKNIKSKMWNESFKNVSVQGKELANGIKKTLSKVDVTNKDKVLAQLDKHLIGYMNRFGTISPDSLLTNEFLSFYSGEMQPYAADVFKEYINTIRRRGNSGYAYNDFRKFASAYKGTGNILSSHSYGASGMLLNEMGYSNYFGGETYSNTAKIQKVYNRLGSRKTHSINDNIGEYEEYNYTDEGIMAGLKKDFQNIKSAFNALGSYTPENGDYGNAYIRFAEDLVENDMTEQLIQNKMQEEIDEYAATSEMQKLKVVNPEEYSKRLGKKTAEVEKKYKKIKQKTVKEMIQAAKETAQEVYKDSGADKYVKAAADSRAGKTVFEYASRSKKYAEKMGTKADNILSKNIPLYGKAKASVKDMIASKGKISTKAKRKAKELLGTLRKAGISVKDYFTKNSAKDILNDVKSGATSGFNTLKDAASDPEGTLNTFKSFAGETFEKVKNNENVQGTINAAKEIGEGIKNSEAYKKTKAKVDEALESETAREAKKTLTEGLHKAKDELFKGFRNAKDAIFQEEDPEVVAEREAKNARFKELRQKGKERTKEENKEYYNLIMNKTFSGIGSIFSFIMKPTKFIAAGIWNAFKHVTFDSLLPSIWEFSKFTRGLERQFYKNLFTKMKKVLFEMPKKMIDTVTAIPGKITEKVGSLVQGFLNVWNAPLFAALRSKEMEQIKGVMPKFLVKAAEMAKNGIGLFKGLFDKDNENSWRNRLNRFKNRKKDDKKTDEKGEKKEGLLGRLKGLFLGVKNFLTNPLTAITAGITAIGPTIFKVGQMLLKPFQMIAKVLGGLVSGAKGILGGLWKASGFAVKGLGAATKFVAKTAGKAALHGTSALAAGAGKLMGKEVTTKGIAGKIIDTLNGFKTQITKRLGKKAGAKFIAKMASKIAARAVPFIGQSLLLYDAAKAIKYMTIDGLDMKSAISKAVLGFDLFNDEEPILDEDGNPIKPDEEGYVAAKEDQLLREQEKDADSNIKLAEESVKRAKEKWAKKAEEQKAAKAKQEASDKEAKEKAKAEAKKNQVQFLEERFEKDKDRWNQFREALDKVDINQWDANLKLRINDMEYPYGIYVAEYYFTLALYGMKILWDMRTGSHLSLVTQDGVSKDGAATYKPVELSTYIARCQEDPKGKDFLAAVCGADVSKIDTAPKGDLKNMLSDFIHKQVVNIQNVMLRKAQQGEGGVTGIIKTILGVLFGNKKHEVTNITRESQNYAKDRKAQQEQAMTNAALSGSSVNDVGISNLGSLKTKAANVNEVEANKKALMPVIMSKMEDRGWSKQEQIHFLSQISHETGGFKYLEEIADGSDYEGRSDLGNTQAGDGTRFKGRGLIQLTGRANYAKFDQHLGLGGKLLRNPELVANDPNLAVESAFYYWENRKSWDKSFRNAVTTGDIVGVTKGVNGGTNGLGDRTNRYNYYANNYDQLKKQYSGSSAEMSSSNGSDTSSRIPTITEAIEAGNVHTNSVSTYQAPMPGESFGSSTQSNQNWVDLPISDQGSTTEAGKAADVATQRAAGASTGYCARRVREALEAGGYKLPANMPRSSAYMYKDILPQMGFKEISPSSQFQKGDVMVFDNNRSHPHGHIQIYNGSQWVSDFKQNNMIPYRDKSSAGRAHLFRDIGANAIAGSTDGGEITTENANMSQDGNVTSTSGFNTIAEDALKAGGGFLGNTTLPGLNGVGGAFDALKSDVNGTIDNVKDQFDNLKSSGSGFMSALKDGANNLQNMKSPFGDLGQQFKSTLDVSSKQLNTQQSMADTLEKILAALQGSGDDKLASTRVQNQSKTSSVEMGDNKPLTDPKLRQHPPAFPQAPALVIQRGSSLVQQV